MEAPAKKEDPTSTPWSVKDVRMQICPLPRILIGFQIVYISCVSPILLAAFLEWFLWLAAFFYCLGKAFRKADRWSQQVLAFILAVVFLAIR